MSEEKKEKVEIDANCDVSSLLFDLDIYLSNIKDRKKVVKLIKATFPEGEEEEGEEDNDNNINKDNSVISISIEYYWISEQDSKQIIHKKMNDIASKLNKNIQYRIDNNKFITTNVVKSLSKNELKEIPTRISQFIQQHVTNNDWNNFINSQSMSYSMKEELLIDENDKFLDIIFKYFQKIT